jgi:hypothetical protein
MKRKPNQKPAGIEEGLKPQKCACGPNAVLCIVYQYQPDRKPVSVTCITGECSRKTKPTGKPPLFPRIVFHCGRWPYRVGSTKRTQYVGKLINKLIYEQLPAPVLPTLQERNPVTERGYRKHKHFQFLTADTGNVHLDRQITAVTMIMKVSDDKKDFEDNFKRAFAKEYQERLPLVVDVAKD